VGDTPISSDPEDPGYREDWKGLLARGLPEHLDIIAQTVFEAAQSKPNIDPDLEFEVADDAEPGADQAEQDDQDADKEPGEVETIDSPLGS